MRGEQFARQIRGICRNAASRAPVAVGIRQSGKEREIIGLAWMHHAKGMREERAAPRDGREVRRISAGNDLRERVILFYDDDDVRRPGRRRPQQQRRKKNC